MRVVLLLMLTPVVWFAAALVREWVADLVRLHHQARHPACPVCEANRRQHPSHRVGPPDEWLP